MDMGCSCCTGKTLPQDENYDECSQKEPCRRINLAPALLLAAPAWDPIPGVVLRLRRYPVGRVVSVTAEQLLQQRDGKQMSPSVCSKNRSRPRCAP